MLRKIAYKLSVFASLLLCTICLRAAPVTIDFESLNDSESLTSQIAGVTFSNALALSAGISLNELDFPPHSGSNVIVDDGAAIIIDFATPISAISGFFTYTNGVVLTWYDAALNLLGSTHSAFDTNLPDIGDLGSTPNELLSVTFTDDIRRIVIGGAFDGFSFALDDLTYTPKAIDPDTGVPEPGTLALLFVAALALVRYARPTKTNRAVQREVPRRHFSLKGVLGITLLLVANVSSAQSIPPVNVNPTSATAGAATTVTATVAIADARLTSVNLFKVDAAGRSTNLGAMHDDGLNGDASANDRTFTLRFTVLEASPTTNSYKASAVLRGVLPRVVSIATAFTIVNASLTKAIEITTGNIHTCALTTTGGVKCWGGNSTGELGVGNLVSPQLLATDVLGLTSGVTSIQTTPTSFGTATCALTVAGAVKCWGYNGWGGIGDGTFTDNPTPQDVVGLSGSVKRLGIRDSTSCVVMVSGSAKCWGANNGQIAFPLTATNFRIPIPQDSFLPLTDVAAISGNFVVTTAGGVKSIGADTDGSLGQGTYDPCPSPTSNDGCSSGGHPLGDVIGLTSGVASVSSGLNNACVRTTSNGIKCWGSNRRGMLGQGLISAETSSPIPLDVPGLTTGVAAVSVGGFHVCALTSAGGVKCWGENFSGQLGIGSFGPAIATPQDVVGLSSGVVAISAGLSHQCALMTSGAIKCWGNNGHGQLGNNSTVRSPTPVDVLGF